MKPAENKKREFKILESVNIDDEALQFKDGEKADGTPDAERITSDGVYPSSEPIGWIGLVAAFLAKANLTVFSSHSKGGKTSFIYSLLAGALCALADVIYGIKIKPATDGKAVVVIDTEQAQEDQQYLVRTVEKRMGVKETPSNFWALNFRGYAPKVLIEKTTKALEVINERCGGIHLIAIDGGADFLKSVNDEEASSEMVQYFTNLAIKYDCPVIVVVHTNPGGEKERGHFGSDLQRKCYALLNIVKDGDISTVQPKLLRKAGMSDAPLIHFRYDPDKGYHVATDDPKSCAATAQKKKVALIGLANTLFDGAEIMPHGLAVNKIMRIRDVRESAAKQAFGELVAFGLIEKTGPGKQDPYRLTAERSERSEKVGMTHE